MSSWWQQPFRPCTRGRAASLYANYVITDQKPRAGAKLRVGVVVPGGRLRTDAAATHGPITLTPSCGSFAGSEPNCRCLSI